MTTLDEIVNLLKIQDKIIEGDQFTPTSIRLTLLEKDLGDYLENMMKLKTKVRFIEKKFFNKLDVHLELILNEIPLDLTLRVLDSTKASYQYLITFFPSIETYIREIKEKEGI